MGGGTVVPTVNNALGNSTVVVSENSILKPTNQTLNFHYESNNLDGAQNDAVYGAGLHVNDPFNPNALLGAVNGTIPGQTNIAQIDGSPGACHEGACGALCSGLDGDVRGEAAAIRTTGR